MELLVQQVSKKFSQEWIFKQVNLQFGLGKYALKGSNGSGKSTLLQILAGYIQPTKGHVQLLIDDKPVTPEFYYQHVAMAAPYLELIEEYTATELIAFQQKLKPMYNYSVNDMLASVNLYAAKHKMIQHFSSGMKQRLKLLLAFYSNCHILLLDEPCSNLDVEGFTLFDSLLEQLTQNRIVIIASNDPAETKTCTTEISLQQYK